MRGAAVSGTEDNSAQNWRKSSRSYGTGQCVEVSGAERIRVRDTANPSGTILQFSQADWATFLSVIRRDFPRS